MLDHSAEAHTMQEITAVLFSGGLDSAVLVAQAAQDGPVQPLYVSAGLAWEAQELQVARRFLSALTTAGNLRPLAPLRFDMTDVYPPTHWAIRGEAPAFDTPDEDVYLDGRNIVLLSKAAVFMARAHRAGVDRAARRQPVSRRHRRVLRCFRPRAVARARRADRDRSAVCRSAQGGRDSSWPAAAGAAGADAVVHAARGRRPLRTLQQMPRAP